MTISDNLASIEMTSHITEVPVRILLCRIAMTTENIKVARDRCRSLINSLAKFLVGMLCYKALVLQYGASIPLKLNWDIRG